MPLATESDLAQLYDACGARCYRLAYGILRDREHAEDAVQEAFLSAWASRASYDTSKGTLATWILTLTHHKAVDIVRKLSTRPALMDCEILIEYPDPRPGPDAAAIRDEQRRSLHAALKCLSRDQRQVLALAYYGGYTQKEIADMIDKPLGTVKTRTLAAIRTLRQQLPDPRHC